MMQDHISQHIKFRHTFFDDRDYWEERNRQLCSFFIMPGGSQAGYRISRLLRFNSADSAHLSRSTAFNGTAVTLSLNCKRAALGSGQLLFGWTDGLTNSVQFQFNASDQLEFYTFATTFTSRKVTTAVYRDPSAHMHIVLVWDTANATASDRIRIYVNGVRVTSFGTSSDPSLNFTASWATNHTWKIGGETSLYGNFLLSDIHLVDGQALTADSFGKFDAATGAWVPKRYTGTYGTNGFYLDFSDNSNTTSATLGKDRSGNNNDWTPNNFSVAAGPGNDSLTDTPTNNFCTLNPLDKASAGTLSNGNLDYTTSSGGFDLVRSSMFFDAATADIYWEVSPTSGANHMIGIARADASFSNFLGQDAAGWAYAAVGQYYNNNSASGSAASYTTSDVIGVHLHAGTLTFYKNAVSQGNAVTGLTGLWSPALSDASGGGSAGFSVNFGQRPFAHTAPSGAKALCTQNLHDPAIKDPRKGFVATTESGANIKAALAALRSDWTDYIEIFKRTDSTEGWRWRFSDDTGNYLDSSSQNAKTTFPSLSGTTYVGYAIRCDAGYPARTGEQAHTNGVATTITHNLGNARALICVKNSGAGSTDWWVYHPELTAGSLVRLNTADNQTANTTITNVGANSFDIGSAAATGTYRWFIVAETDGFFSLGKHTGNANANGPYAFTGQDSALIFFRELSASGFNWRSYDRQRSTYNPAIANLNLNTTAGEQTSAGNALGDFLAGGYKIRETNGGINSSGGTIIYAAFAKTAFKYARAA